MNAADELRHLKDEVVPALAMMAYSIGRLAEMPHDAEVDSFQLDADAMMWWHRIEAKSRDLED